MMHARHVHLRGVLAVLFLTLLSAAPALSQVAKEQLTQAADFAAQAKWDEAIDVLTAVIEAQPPDSTDAETRRVLAIAYEQRALALYQVGKRDLAQLDITTLLRLDPQREISSPGLAKAFADTRIKTLAQLDLSVEPKEAVVTLVEEQSPDPAAVKPVSGFDIRPQWLRPGRYTLRVSRPGYAPWVQQLELAPGRPDRQSVVLQRTAAVVLVRTTQPGVRIFVDGELRGETAADPGGSAVSSLLLDSLTPRANEYDIRLEKDCYRTSSQKFRVVVVEGVIQTMDPDRTFSGADRETSPLSLERASGAILVRAPDPQAVVYVNDTRRGVAGETLADLCPATYTVDVRAATGRYRSTVAVNDRATTDVNANLLPTYGLLALPGAAGATPSEADVQSVAKALRPRSLQLMVVTPQPPIAGLPALMKAGDGLMETSAIQGLAALTSSGDQNGDWELTLLAKGARRADTIRFSRAAIGDTSTRLDAEPTLVANTLGADLVDIESGVLVTSIDPAGPANGLLTPGQIIVGIDVNEIRTVDQVLKALEKPADRIAVRLRDNSTPVTLAPKRAATLAGTSDGILSNTVITTLRARISQRQDRDGKDISLDAPLVDGLRLNLAVALMSVEDWAGALETLNGLSLTGRVGVGRGTVEYLRGLCLKRMGNVDAARARFEAAAAEPEARLGERGPLVAHLAARELATTLP